jgi:glycosyltransferase involved in cell wall biosynthesis
MRIGLVVPGGVDPPGGERVIPFVHHLVESLSAQHDVTVVAVGHDREAAEWTLFGARVVNVPLGTHSKADIARVLVQVPKAMGHRGRPDVVHGLWANLPGLAAVAAARRFSVPSVVSVCGGELAAVPEIDYGGGLRTGTRRLAIAALRGATEVTVATEWMHRHVFNASSSAGEIIPLGADLRHLTTSSSAVTDPNRLVHVGGLNRVKDQDLLLRAFALLAADRPALTLTIAGGDTLDGHHRRLAEELGVAERVTFLGHVPHEQLGEVLHGAALHLLTSHHDAGPVAVIEAAACGVPTVGTDVGHVADFSAGHSRAAVAVRDRSPAAFADAVGALLDDRPRRDELAANAQRWALRHDAVFTALTFEALYRRLSARRISA